jgi:hypothetical protein
MANLTGARHAGDFKVEVRFDTGESALVDLRDAIFKYEAALSLRTPEAFARFHISGSPTIEWDCGFDLSPEYLYELATGKRPAWAE